MLRCLWYIPALAFLWPVVTAEAIEPLRPSNVRSTAASSPDELEKELGLVAEQLAKFLVGAREDSLSVGEFTGPPQLSTRAGPGVAQLLTKALERLNIRSLPRAKLGLQGKYFLDESKATIRGELVDLSGKTLFTFSRDLENPASFATLFGPTGTLDTSSEGNANGIEDAVFRPQSSLTGPRVLASPNSPFGMEIHVKKDTEYLPRRAEDISGLAFLKIARGEAYAVQLVNNSPHDAAVRLSIDGISVFAFSENSQYKHFIVKAKEKKLITGWHRTNRISDEFFVTGYSNSVAAQLLPSSPSLGTITATFAPAWGETEKPLDRAPLAIATPASGPSEYKPQTFKYSKTVEATPGSAAPSPDAPAAEPDATGRGKEVEQKYTELRRFVGPIRAVITVRYTKENQTDAPGLVDMLIPEDSGEWLEITSHKAEVKKGIATLMTLSAGDIVRHLGKQGEWHYISARQPSGESVEGFVFGAQASEFSIPFASDGDLAPQ